VTPVKLLYIIRGLPGSGKTTLARQLAPDANAANDDYFYGPAGYQFDERHRLAAKAACLLRISGYLAAGISRVAVHNTFILRQHYAEYVHAADVHGYGVMTVTLTSQFTSVHNVPPHVLRSMRQHWQP